MCGRCASDFSSCRRSNCVRCTDVQRRITNIDPECCTNRLLEILYICLFVMSISGGVGRGEALRWWLDASIMAPDAGAGPGSARKQAGKMTLIGKAAGPCNLGQGK